MECEIHKKVDCPICLKKCLEEILFNTQAAGNGGYVSEFGPLLFSKIVQLTAFDTTKRKIFNHGK